jgi:hypothetical protein
MKKGVKSCDKGRQTERKREGKERKLLSEVDYSPISTS